MLPSCEMVRRAGGCLGFVKCERLKRVLVAFAGADAQRGFDMADENLAVADAAGLCGGGDRLDDAFGHRIFDDDFELRSEEHTSELQSLMRISYAVFCLNKK